MDFITYMNSLRNYRAEEIKKLAEITESSTSAVYQWISGKTKVPPLKRKIIAQHLGVSVHDLWPDEKE